MFPAEDSGQETKENQPIQLPDSADSVSGNELDASNFSIGRSAVTPTPETRAFPTKDGGVIGPASFSIGAYHGTPHKVDKFTTSKIGTGEGISPHRMEFEGKQYVVRMSVREDANGQRFYDHEFTDISEESSPPPSDRATRASGASGSFARAGQRTGEPPSSVEGWRGQRAPPGQPERRHLNNTCENRVCKPESSFQGEEARNAASGFARTEGASSSGLGDGGQRNGTPFGSTTKSREAPLAQDLPKEDTRNILAEILSASPNHLSKGEVEERLWEMSSTHGTTIESADGSGEEAGMAATDRDSTAADAPASQRGTTGASPAPTSSRTRKKDASNNPSSTTDTC